VIVDTNVTLGLWPFRRVPGDTASDLVARLKRRGVTQAWAGTFDGVFHRDLTAANARLAKACETAGAGFLLPFGSVNPRSAGWREDLRRCHEVHKMRGIRLHPNYHSYTLTDEFFAEVLREARDRKLIVQLVLALEDERSQNLLMRVPPVDPSPLARIVKNVPDLRLIVLNRGRNPSGDALIELTRSGDVYFDLAMIEGAGCAGELMSVVSEKRVVFGSHSPFQYFESALLKVQESGIAGEQKLSLLAGNAKRLLETRG
jgi:predicted TIM-barrel fold metal-dependent hydrolase